MIETTLYTYLNLVLSPIPVYTEIPKNRPEKFVTFEKTGGSRENMIDTATIALQCWAKSIYEAAELCVAVKGIMDASVALEEISKAEYVSDYNYTDTSTKHYRYQTVYQVTHY